MQIWQGDSGGSMNYKQMDGRWKQIGIISFGSTEGCQKKRVIQTVTTD
jgi:secreted trypsin-like serine protease